MSDRRIAIEVHSAEVITIVVERDERPVYRVEIGPEQARTMATLLENAADVAEHLRRGKPS